MPVLHHFWLCPFSRKLRIVLGEKRLEYDSRVEKYWERGEAFLALNPAGQVPVLVLEDGTALAESGAIAEYLDECHPGPPLLGDTPEARAEVRRLAAWFDQKFFREVTDFLMGEKLLKRFMKMGQPDTELIRAAHHNMKPHLDYLGWLAERRNWLAGNDFSLADAAAAAQLSTLDYLGDVPWHAHGGAKDWYARVKSRPSFRPLLSDHVAALPPPRHYTDLDF